MRLPSILRRRPSAALIIACGALFVSLGGASYAAVTIPNNSVGATQIKKNAVTNSKLAANSVTYKKIAPNTVGKCAAGTAVATITKDGKVTCNTALPAGLQTTSNSATISPTATGPTTVSSLSLPAGPTYQVLANPTVSVSGIAAGSGNVRVQVSCTLTVGGSTQTRSVTVIGTPTETTSASVPLQLDGASGTASATCTATSDATTLPTTSVTAALNALQLAPS